MGNYRNKGGMALLLLYGAIVIGTLGIGAAKVVSKLGSNRDNLDTEKAFNTIIDYDNGSVSISKMNSYSDYQGMTIEFTTQDGLQILSGLDNAILVTGNNLESVYQEALLLSGNHPENIIYYDEVRGLDTTITNNGWNKSLLNLNYTFNYVIIETTEGVVVRELTTYRDWDSDDKIQYQTKDGNVYLGDFEHIKLVNTSLAEPKSLYYYAVSLAGSEDKVYGDINKNNQETSVHHEDNREDEDYAQTSFTDKPKTLTLERKS